MGTPLDRFLLDRREVILDAALAHASAVPRYRELGPEEIHERLDALLDRLIHGVAERDLVPVAAYARGLAAARFANGFALSEVQVAINALEEAVWQEIAQGLPSAELGEGLALVATVLGAAKDALAQEYVLLAAGTSAPRIDVGALFHGTG